MCVRVVSPCLRCWFYCWHLYVSDSFFFGVLFCFSCFVLVIQGCWRFFSFLRRFVIVFVYRWYYHVCLFVVISFMIPLSFSLSQEVSTGYTEVCNTSGGDSNRNIGRGNAVIIFTGCTSVTVQIITVMQTGNPSRI